MESDVYLYAEDPVVGFFTFKQVVPVLVLGAVAWYATSQGFAYAREVLVACGTLALLCIVHLAPKKIRGEYAIRAYFSGPGGVALLEHKVATLTALALERKGRGLEPDRNTERALALLEKLKNEPLPRGRT